MWLLVLEQVDQETQRPTAFEVRGGAPVGIAQTQANRAKFGGMGEDEFSSYTERARQSRKPAQKLVGMGANGTFDRQKDFQSCANWIALCICSSLPPVAN
jgi:hypothetical protein